MDKYRDANLSEVERALVHEIERASREVGSPIRIAAMLNRDARERILDKPEEALRILGFQALYLEAALSRAEDSPRSLPMCGLPLRREPVDLGEMARSSVPTSLTREGRLSDFRPDCWVEVSTTGDLSVQGDPDVLRLALAPLVLAAVAADKQGEATVGRGVDGAFFVALGGEGLEWVVFCVGTEVESGPPPSPYFRYDVSRAREAVERHGGRLWIEQETGRAATFWFTLE